ncbi:hypothetical protein Dimus_031626 [Dionaea muscipula]
MTSTDEAAASSGQPRDPANEGWRQQRTRTLLRRRNRVEPRKSDRTSRDLKTIVFGRLQFVDAISCIDAMVLDLPSTWNTADFYEIPGDNI